MPEAEWRQLVGKILALKLTGFLLSISVGPEDAHASYSMYYYSIVGSSGYCLYLYVLCQYMKKTLTRGQMQEQAWFQVFQVAWNSESLFAIAVSFKEKPSPHSRSEKELRVLISSGQLSVRETLPAQLSEKKKRSK